MGQEANSRRNASLDDKKRRAAGRRSHHPEGEAIRDFIGIDREGGRAAGAFGQSADQHFVVPSIDPDLAQGQQHV